MQQMMQFKMVNLEDGMKYLGYFLNHNHYIKEDWLWLIRKVKKRIYHWLHRELSLGGRLILVKLVLDIILVYCLSLENTPKFIMKNFRQKCFQSLWIGKKKEDSIWLNETSWKYQNRLGGGDQKYLWFWSSPCSHEHVEVFFYSGLWISVTKDKYLKSVQVEYWIRRNPKSTYRVSNVWRGFIWDFLISQNYWHGRLERKKNIISVGPWIGGEGCYKMLDVLVQALRSCGFFTMS